MPTRARDHFTSTLIEGNKRINTNPQAEKAKLELRRLLLGKIGPANAHVFDAYAGDGQMYRGVWNEAASYVGCDFQWFRDERVCYVADNRRVMRCIDLSPYSIVDFDSHGSPWEAITIFCARRSIAPGERLGVAITEGSGLRLKMGWIPDALALISGLRRHMPGVARNQADIIDRALLSMCARLNAKMVARWQARGKSASSLYYLAVVLEGLPA